MLLFEDRGGIQRLVHHRCQRDYRAVFAAAQHLGLAKLVDVFAIGHLAFHRIERLLLEEQYRVGIAYRCREQAFDIGGKRRRHHLDAGNHHRPVLDRLRMLRAEARTRAVRRAYHQRQGYLPVGHVTRFRDLVGHDVPAHREEIRKHDFSNRPQARHRRAHRSAQYRLLRNRAIAHALGPEFLQQTDRRLEYAARRCDVFAEKHDAFVARHFLRYAGGDRFAISQFRHAAPPLAHTFFSISSINGSGDAFAVAVAASTLPIAAASMSFRVGSLKPFCSRRSR